jgi:hypothetical protein
MDVRGVGTEDTKVALASLSKPAKSGRRTLILGWIALGLSIVVSACWTRRKSAGACPRRWSWWAA